MLLRLHDMLTLLDNLTLVDILTLVDMSTLHDTLTLDIMLTLHDMFIVDVTCVRVMSIYVTTCSCMLTLNDKLKLVDMLPLVV